MSKDKALKLKLIYDSMDITLISSLDPDNVLSRRKLHPILDLGSTNTLQSNES